MRACTRAPARNDGLQSELQAKREGKIAKREREGERERERLPSIGLNIWARRNRWQISSYAWNDTPCQLAAYDLPYIPIVLWRKSLRNHSGRNILDTWNKYQHPEVVLFIITAYQAFRDVTKWHFQQQSSSGGATINDSRETLRKGHQAVCSMWTHVGARSWAFSVWHVVLLFQGSGRNKVTQWVNQNQNASAVICCICHISGNIF